jgi:hypothetical protein
MSHCLGSLDDIDSSMSFSTSTTAALQAVTKDIDLIELPQRDSGIVKLDVSLSFSQPLEETESHALELAATTRLDNETWKQYARLVPFLAVPPEIHLKIISFLHPIDATCLSLVK